MLNIMDWSRTGNMVLNRGRMITLHIMITMITMSVMMTIPNMNHDFYDQEDCW